MCEVLPPRNLYHGILPVKMHNKLLFPLCKKCAVDKIQYECPHNREEDRKIRGTWVSLEVQKAVKHGYKVLRVDEIWQYKTTQYDQETDKGGLFAHYINKFFAKKTMASGYPPGYTTEEDKKRYVELLKTQEGIRIDPEQIAYNPGLRSISKLSLNCLW